MKFCITVITSIYYSVNCQLIFTNYDVILIGIVLIIVFVLDINIVNTQVLA